MFNQQRDQRRHIIGDRGTPTSKDVSLDPNNHLRCFHSVCHHATSASMAATISAGWMRRQNRLRELIVRVGFQFRIVSGGNADQSGIKTRVS